MTKVELFFFLSSAADHSLLTWLDCSISSNLSLSVSRENHTLIPSLTLFHWSLNDIKTRHIQMYPFLTHCRCPCFWFLRQRAIQRRSGCFSLFYPTESCLLHVIHVCAFNHVHHKHTQNIPYDVCVTITPFP